MSDLTTHPLSRRRLLALSGAAVGTGSAALALSACGSAATDEAEETDAAREAELLNEVAGAQLAVIEAVKEATRASDKELAAAFSALGAVRENSVASLIEFAEELDGSSSATDARPVAAESAVEALGLTLDASIATSLDAIREITTDAYRQLVHRSITEDAAHRALIADTLGEEYATEAFVNGDDAPDIGGAGE